MKQGLGIYYYVLFKTTAPDGSAFFGIHRTQNPSWGEDGQAISYIGNGPKLAAKARQFGISRLVTTVIALDPNYDVIRRKLDTILNPATLADPRCLNMPLPERNKAISEALSGQPKSEDHKEAIAVSMVDNQNALGHIKTEEARETIAESKTGLKWYHNPETAEELQLMADEDILTGFQLGRLPKELKSKFKKDRKVELTDNMRARMSRD